MNTLTLLAAGLIIYLLGKPKPTKPSFQDKLQMAGRWAEIEFTDESIPYGIQSYEINLYDKGELDTKSLPLLAPDGKMMYSKPRVRMLERMGIPVIPVDLNKEIPDEYTEIPAHEIMLDRLELERWFK